MREYWPKRLFKTESVSSATAQAAGPSTVADGALDAIDEYDRERMKRLQSAESEDGWKAELQRYLNDPAPDVKRDTNTLKWWAVSTYAFLPLMGYHLPVSTSSLMHPCTQPSLGSPLTSFQLQRQQSAWRAYSHEVRR